MTGNDEDTQMVIEAGIVSALGNLLGSTKELSRKEAAWALSNIAAGNSVQLQVLINEGVISKVAMLGLKDTFDVRRECIWCLTNSVSNATPEQLKVLIDLGTIEALCDILSQSDPRTMAIALEGIECSLKKAKTEISPKYADEIALRIEKCKGLNALESLETHANTFIYNKAIAIIEEYFGVEETIESEDTPKSISIFDF